MRQQSPTHSSLGIEPSYVPIKLYLQKQAALGCSRWGVESSPPPVNLEVLLSYVGRGKLVWEVGGNRGKVLGGARAGALRLLWCAREAVLWAAGVSLSRGAHACPGVSASAWFALGFVCESIITYPETCVKYIVTDYRSF